MACEERQDHEIASEDGSGPDPHGARERKAVAREPAFCGERIRGPRRASTVPHPGVSRGRRCALDVSDATVTSALWRIWVRRRFVRPGSSEVGDGALAWLQASRRMANERVCGLGPRANDGAGQYFTMAG